MIEEQQLVFVAAADYTDECRVDVRMRRKHMDLSASQARQFARELVDAAEAADRAAASVVRPVAPAAFDFHANTFTEKFFHPECVAGKCSNCDGQVLTIDDRWVPCQHHCHTTGAAA